MIQLKQIKNGRQVPKQKEICANKKYYDIMYAYFQCNSNPIYHPDDIGKFVEDRRIIGRQFEKRNVKFAQLGRIFNISRQTASTKFKNLMSMGLIEDGGAEYYFLPAIKKDVAMLVPYKTLKLLTDALNENSISIYVYLLNRYSSEGFKPFIFTLTQLKSVVGICTDTRSNDEIITNILVVLEKLGLIKYHLTGLSDSDNAQNMRTIYQIDKVENEIENFI